MSTSDAKVRRIHAQVLDDKYAREDTCHSGCAGRAARMPLRRTFGFTSVEELTLDLMRCIWNVYATGSAQGWDVAIRAAEEHFGASGGPELVAHATAMVRALGLERQRSFSYLSFGCLHVSSDELAVMTFIKACRMRNGNVGQSMIRILLGGDGASDRSRAAGDAMGRFQRTCSQTGERPSHGDASPGNDIKTLQRGDYLH